MSNAIALLEQNRTKLEQLVPATAQGFSVPDIIRQAASCFQDNHKLNNCDPKSIATAVKYAVQLGLNIHGPLKQAYLVPYGDQCKFDLQYQGLLELTMRTGLYKKIVAKVVHENDDFTVNEDDSVSHRFKLSGRGEIVGFYAFAIDKNDNKFTEVFTKEEMDYLESTSRKGSSSTPAWVRWYSEMGRKSALKRLIKWLPKTGAGDAGEVLNTAIKIDNQDFELEKKTLEEGEKQRKEMEEAGAFEQSKQDLEKVLEDAKANVSEDQYNGCLKIVKTDNLKSVMQSIDFVKALIIEVKGKEETIDAEII